MKDVFGYIRVSTIRQGQGVSLQEQKSAILTHARANNLDIVEWFEEKETAAKRGRPIFSTMLERLRNKDASGVIIHKIDRSARNLKDWAELGELLDSGVDVHFAYESIDLHARGGRLSADIQAVIAADYIRNLRDETKKGVYGRLKQGLYPLPAPIGYLNMGSGKPKKPDPQKAPYIKLAFQLYATGRHSLDEIKEILTKKGLKSFNHGKLSRNGIATILHNPFYIGIIRINRTNEIFKGIHKPIISKRLFDKVQDVLAGKNIKGSGKHCFPFRRLFKCATCGYAMIGEKQKQFVYYRCHSKTCKGTIVRQDKIERLLKKKLKPLKFSKEDVEEINEVIKVKIQEKEDEIKDVKKSLKLKHDKLKTKLDNLTDALIDGDIDKDSFNRRKESILFEMKDIEENLREIESNKGIKSDEAVKKLELLKSLYLSYVHGSEVEKRELLKTTTSNLSVYRKKVVITLHSPFQELSKRLNCAYSSP